MKNVVNRALAAKKKLLLTFFAAILCAANVLADDSGTCGENLTWTYNTEDSTLTISGTGTMPEWQTSTPWEAYRLEIAHVIIQEGVANIGRGSFLSTHELTSIDIPNSVTKIGEAAFYWCENLSSIVLPTHLDTIGVEAFYGCESITSIEFPESLTFIGEWAFCGCSGLGSIVVPSGVTEIGESAFDQIFHITYEGSATGSPWGARSMNGYMDGWLVYDDANRTHLLACDPNATGDLTLPNRVNLINERAFYQCNGLNSVTIPEGITYIGSQTFYDCTGLTSVSLPNSVDSIASFAFMYCSALSTFEMSDNVTYLGNQAFSYCSNLTSVTLSDNLTRINNLTFRECSSLTSIEIPASVDSIGTGAFYKCVALQTVINHAATPQNLKANVFGSVNQSACALYVPGESIALYQAKDVWKDFGTILPLSQVPAGIEPITNDPLPTTNKILRDGQVFILRGDKTYTVTGQEVK